MVHDRRIESGQVLSFGSQGALYKNAQTWWDRETLSIWSQPWGEAIDGPLHGTRLRLMSSNMVPWATWLEDHPQTLLLKVDGLEGGSEPAWGFNINHVILISEGAHTKVYPFGRASRAGIINDHLGPFPVVVSVDPETKGVHVYLRSATDGDLEFSLRDGKLVDLQTESTWDIARGMAVDGPLKGELLTRVPYRFAFGSNWLQFYPDAEIYEETLGSSGAGSPSGQSGE